MPDKKLTDNEIIKALECCSAETDCKRCPLYKEHSVHCIDIACKNALDLITRQQEEIESLKIFRGYAEKRASDYRTMRDKYLNAKSEAYKEFSEKAKEFMHNKFKALDEYEFEYITESDIDNLVKEMGGDDNA